MDAFFASVEIYDDPSLAGLPVVVGGKGARGVVAAASYEARAYGVHSAMPSGRAQRLCPEATWISGRYDRYVEVSGRLHELFHEVTPVVEGIALDEAFLDVGGSRRLLGDAEAIAHRLRDRVEDVLGLTCSVGVARVKLIAKLASEAAKPTPGRPGGGAAALAARPGRGVVVIRPADELGFLQAHKIRALWGVGPATAARLARYGVVTIGDLAALPVDTLVGALGDANGRHLHDLANARDHRSVVADVAVKSIGHEETFAADLVGAEVVHREVVRLCDAVATRLRRSGVAARTVQVKVRFPDFTTPTRSRTLAVATDTGAEICAVVDTLLAGLDLTPGVRLLGVSCSGLAPPPERQLDMFDGGVADATAERVAAAQPKRAGAAARAAAATALDEVRQRFGDGSLAPATVLRRGVKRKGDTQWGPSVEEVPRARREPLHANSRPAVVEEPDPWQDGSAP